MSAEQDEAGAATRFKMPKRVAGVKLPKPLRHAVEEALEQLTSSAGRLVLASALEAAAAALRRGAGDATGTRPAGGSTIDRVGPMIGLAANALGQWLGDAARKPAAAPHTEEPPAEDTPPAH